MTYAERDQTLRSLGYFDYAEYLESPLWRDIRNDVLRRDNHSCCLCNRPAKIVHHRSYSEFVLTGEDRSSRSLVSLCDPCHYAVEFRGKAKRTFVESEVVYARLARSGGRFKASNKKRRNKPKQIKENRRPPIEKRCVACKANLVKKCLRGKAGRLCVVCERGKAKRDAFLQHREDVRAKRMAADAEYKAIVTG